MGVVEFLVIAVLAAIFIAAYFLSERVKISDAFLAVSLFFMLIYVVTVLFMFLGVRKERPGYLIPHLVLQISAILALAAAVGLSIAVLAITDFHWVEKETGDEENTVQSNRTEILAIVVLIFACILLAFQIWFLTVVFKCYRFLKAKIIYMKYFGKLGPGPARALFGPLSKAYSPTDPLMPWIDE